MSKKPFRWTNKLVKKFIIDLNNGKPYAPVYLDDYIKKFKEDQTKKTTETALSPS